MEGLLNRIDIINLFSGLSGKIFFGIIFILVFLCDGCVEPYDAEIDEVANVVSIEAGLIKGEAIQSVIISRTSSLVYPQFKPIRECEVFVVDETDNQFRFNENFNGTYTMEIPDDQLILGRKYKLLIATPEGDRYESAYERLNSGVAVDTVYYQIEEELDEITENNYKGLQFYVDLEAADTTSRYFRWGMEETFEYNSTAPITYYISEDSLSPIYLKDEFQFFTCWKTLKVPGLYLSNTVNLLTNEKKRIPLHYVSTVSDRLKIKYSLLVKQYTMNKGAYNYWQANKISTQESGGIYTQQPGQPLSNIKNIKDSTETVIGYFWASFKNEKRIFVPEIKGLQVLGEVCELSEFNVIDHGPGSLPRYIYIDEKTKTQLTGSPMCFVCTLKGGTIKKPDFWDE
jgi:hypothetical protein